MTQRDVSVFVAATVALPALFAPDADAAKRFAEFFTANIRNPHTRRAYMRAAAEFAAWCEANDLRELRDVEPIHVAAHVETLQARLAAPSVKLHLAAIRMLFDWLVIGQVVAVNPASPVRGPKYSVKRGKTPVLTNDEARAFFNSIDVSTTIGLRDRALIALMTYTFARIGAARLMKVEDVYVQGRRLRVRLHEKGGKVHDMPCHHNLEIYLLAYIEGTKLGGNPKGHLFCTALGCTDQLSDRPMSQSDAYRMIQRRAAGAVILTKIGNHSFRATGITEFRRNGGSLEMAQLMADHASPRTTMLYDRSDDQVSLDEVERIVI